MTEKENYNITLDSLCTVHYCPIICELDAFLPPHFLLFLFQPVSYAQLARSIHELAATSDQVCIPSFIFFLWVLTF